MKKLLILYGFMLLLAFNAGAQDCATGYCPDILTVDHYAGDISPQTVRIEYQVVETDLSGDTACWITQNLGATAQAGTYDDTSLPTRGWFWQFNRKQGYSHDGTNRTPSVLNWIADIDENSDWQPENDPCTLLLGGNWRIPTTEEWQSVHTKGEWTTDSGAYDGELKLYNTGRLNASAGELGTNDVTFYNSADQTDNFQRNLYRADNGVVTNVPKEEAFPTRCIRTY